MKIPTTFRPRRGFTLIELLVVIAIIAVLAAAGFAVGASALNRARKLSAQNMATSLDQAVNMFYSEYGTFPIQGGADATNRVDTSQSTAFLETLLGNNATLNPRSVSFLSAKEGRSQGAEGGVDGLVYTDAGAVRGLYDPWGNGFIVEMDTTYEGTLVFDISLSNFSGTERVTLRGRRVAVYSHGADRDEDTNTSTMVKTW